MAKRKPLVLVNGVIERLQSGDRLDLSNYVTKTNGETANLIKATPIYVTGGNARLAQADSQSTVRVAGLVDVEAAPSDPVDVQTEGIFVATTGEWDAVTNQIGGLTEGATYYLDALTAGKLTTTAPDDNGEFVVQVGRALSSTEMDIQIGAPIKL